MELGTCSDLNSFIGDADNPERPFFGSWSPFHIYVLCGIDIKKNSLLSRKIVTKLYKIWIKIENDD